MSDNLIELIPKDFAFVPKEDAHQALIDLFAKIAPNADEIAIKITEGVQFFDCGANFERVICPICEEEIDTEWWQERMAEDYEGSGFRLQKYAVPCCGSALGLNSLNYDWPQGFARFAIEAMNPSIARLSVEQIESFERLAGTPLRVIYRRI